jgi:hypothetical protein
MEESRVLTCVYCGQAYPQDTPAWGDKVLTEHIRVCTKHPLRQAEAKIELLRKALLDVFYAANCALWLLEQEELRSLLKGDWGDPEATRNLLRKAGCVPSCDREQALKLLDVVMLVDAAMLEERKQFIKEMTQPSAQRAILPPVLLDSDKPEFLGKYLVPQDLTINFASGFKEGSNR